MGGTGSTCIDQSRTAIDGLHSTPRAGGIVRASRQIVGLHERLAMNVVGYQGDYSNFVRTFRSFTGHHASIFAARSATTSG